MSRPKSLKPKPLRVPGVRRTALRAELHRVCGCVCQHDGWPCPNCFFSAVSHYWIDWAAVLAFRGDYDTPEYRKADGYLMGSKRPILIPFDVLCEQIQDLIKRLAASPADQRLPIPKRQLPGMMAKTAEELRLMRQGRKRKAPEPERVQ